MTVANVEIPISDHFDDRLGRLLSYEAYDSAQRAQVVRQHHRDIRCFHSSTTTVPFNMFALDSKTMDFLDPLTMGDFFSTDAVYAEGWTLGTVGPQADRNYWRGISIAVNGTVVSASVMSALDLSDMAPSDDLSLALPAFPASSLNLAQCFVDFTSNATGDFTVGPTASVPMTGLASGDRELKVPLSTLAPLGYSVTGVRFRLTSTAACTFRCLAIRVLPADWSYAPVDTNTLLDTIVRPVSRDGSAAAAVTFPANTFSDPLVPTNWPILFRATTPSTFQDPRPIDLSQAVTFYTGHGAGGDIRLYFREYAYDLVSQLDLDLANGSTGIKQFELEALGHAPDFDRALYRAKDQDDLDALPMSNLDGVPQYDLESEPDYFTASWVEARIAWTTGSSTVTIRDTEGNTHTFASAGLAANTRYVAFVELAETAMRVRIHPLSEFDAPDFSTVTFDSTLITDDFMFPRRSGRVGWYATFTDGDAYLDSIRSYEANFAEYRSVALRSLTPVVGGQVFFGGSPAREHFTGVAGINGADVSPDNTKSGSGVAYRVEIVNATAIPGVVTNRFLIDNFREAVVSFDLWFPSSAYADGGRLTAFLTDPFGQQSVLNLGALVTDRWQSHRFDLDVFHGSLLPGYYQLNLVILEPGIKTTFYLDNISVRQQALAWSGRAEAADPWGDGEGAWMPFKEALNSHTAGALFSQIGNHAQVRCLARRQNAALSQVKFMPKYAELGRLVWDDQKPATVEPTISSFTPTDLGSHRVSFALPSGNATLGTGRFIVYHEWVFGDGTFDTGPAASHVYDAPGTYKVALTIVDDQGSRHTHFQDVVVT